MKGKYDINPLLEFCETLKTYISIWTNLNTDIVFREIDPVAKAILANNGCKFEDTGAVYSSQMIMDRSYGLYFIKGAIGNDIHEYFDFIELNGTSYLIIFLDVFKKINAKPDSDDEIALNADVFMGKQPYFDMICKITNIFIATTINPSVFTNQLATTAAARNYRFAPSIIAAYIINDICGRFDENDASGIDYNFINNIIVNNKIATDLYGIYKY